jgi:hypothetical protein
MIGRSINHRSEEAKAKGGGRSIFGRWMQLGLTGRMLLLVVIAVLPALAIQAFNEYTLRRAGEDDIRQRVVQSPSNSARKSKNSARELHNY